MKNCLGTWILLVTFLIALSACGDEKSTAVEPDDFLESSSSISEVLSSSEKTPESSSSQIKSSSSSSEVREESSSSEKDIVEDVLSSSSALVWTNDSIQTALTEIGGECEDWGIAKYRMWMDEYKTFYTCYKGVWYVGSLEIDKYPWDIPNESWFSPKIEYGQMTDSRDGQVYKTVVVGNQTWMAENLRYADSVATPSLKGNNWCLKGDLESCDIVGRFYSWSAAVDSVKLVNENEKALDCGMGKTCGLNGYVKGICDEGWHLPTLEELEDFLASAKVIGGGSFNDFKALRSSVGWDYCRGDKMSGTSFGDETNTNTSGFSALPTGFRFNDGNYTDTGCGAYFWASSETKENYAVSLYITDTFFSAGRNLESTKSWGLNVRCVKDH